MQQRFLFADLIACSTCFGHHYAHHQELKTIIQWLLRVVFRAVVFKLLSILQTGHITLSSTPYQQLENHSTKYHRRQPLYNTLELLMIGIVVPETCGASNRICNKTSVASGWHFISTHFNLLRAYFKPCNRSFATGASATNAVSRDIGTFNGRVVLINGLLDVDIFTK